MPRPGRGIFFGKPQAQTWQHELRCQNAIGDAWRPAPDRRKSAAQPVNPCVDLDTPGNPRKNPEDWVTGDEPMTGAQGSCLKTLCEETVDAFDSTLSKAAASERIDALRARGPRLTPKGMR